MCRQRARASCWSPPSSRSPHGRTARARCVLKPCRCATATSSRRPGFLARDVCGSSSSRSCPTSSPPGLWNWGEMLREGFANNAVRGGWWWWWAPPGVLIAVLGTGLALLNFGIDEFINPRLRAAGITRKAARKAGISVRPKLGMTQVMRERPKAASFPHPSDAVLEIRGLSVDYGYGDEAVHAVVDCNLVLRRGRVLGLA